MRKFGTFLQTRARGGAAALREPRELKLLVLPKKYMQCKSVKSTDLRKHGFRYYRHLPARLLYSVLLREPRRSAAGGAFSDNSAIFQKSFLTIFVRRARGLTFFFKTKYYFKTGCF
jgi:hypothetical protein